MASSFNLKSLDFKTAGFWPKSVQFAFYAGAALIALIAGWFLLISGQVGDLRKAEAKEQQLRDEFKEVQGKASSLGPLKQQLADIEVMLQTSLRQLPSKTEMPEILNDISRLAMEQGLNTELFQPQPETLQDFYAERPIQLRMIGSYHQFGQFMSAVSKLPRVIVITPTNASLQPFTPSEQPAAPPGVTNVLQNLTPQKSLVFDGIVTTYRYLDSDEQAVQDAKREAAEEEARALKEKEEKKKKKKNKADKKDDNKDDNKEE